MAEKQEKLQFEPVVVPAPNFAMGHLNDFADDTIGFVQDIAKHGDFVRARFVNKWANFIFHPDLIRDYLIKKAKYFNKAEMLKKSGHDIIPDNFFAADGEQWKQQHDLIMPAFHAKRIGEYAEAMVDFTHQATANWQTGKEVDMDLEMMELTMRIITKTMFDMELEEDLSEIGHLVEDMFEIFGDRVAQPFVTPSWLPTPQNRRMAQIRAGMFGLMRQAVNKWREKGEDTGDLLSMLMLAEYEDGSKMTDDLLFQELITIFGAGHETTAHTLAYTFHAITTNPDVKAKLQEEIDTVLQGEDATLENIRDLKYTEMVIKESMRMYPVAQSVMREPNQPVDLCGVPIAMGEIVFVSFWATHHDERWYPEPSKFDPERFSLENEKSIPKYAYIPFGGGPRVCIGNQFAMLEACLVLATIMQKFDFEVKEGYTLKPSSAFTTKPEGGLPMIVKVRENIPQHA